MAFIPGMTRTLSEIKIIVWESSHKQTGPATIAGPYLRKENIMIENFLPLELKEGTDFICPVCGETISLPFEPEHCYHVLFILAHDTEEFVYVSEQNRQIIDKSIKEADAHYSALENAIGYLKSTTVIFFEVTFSGIACGPASYTFTIGIDLAN